VTQIVTAARLCVQQLRFVLLFVLVFVLDTSTVCTSNLAYTNLYQASWASQPMSDLF